MTRNGVSKSYLLLVEEFPLTSISSESHLDRATEFMHGLLQRNLDSGEEKYLAALTDLVWVYEQKHHRLPDATAAEVLQYLMEEHGLSQANVAGKARIPRSTVSEILSGKREVSKSASAKLGRLFGVEPSVFFDAAAKEWEAA